MTTPQLRTFKIQTNEGFIPIQADTLIHPRGEGSGMIRFKRGDDIVAQVHESTLFFEVHEDLNLPVEITNND